MSALHVASLGLIVLLVVASVWALRARQEEDEKERPPLPEDYMEILGLLRVNRGIMEAPDLLQKLQDRGARISQRQLLDVLSEMDNEALVVLRTRTPPRGTDGERPWTVSLTNYGMRVLLGKVRHG